MFEVGKKYDFTILEWGDTSPGPVQNYGQIVAEIDGSLVKFVAPAVKVMMGETEMEIEESYQIINTASLYFVSASPSK